MRQVVALDRGGASRRLLAHHVSITIKAAFCVRTLSRAVGCWSAPEIVDTDQGSRFASTEFEAEFEAEVMPIGARQSVDGNGCLRHNVFVGRLRRSVT